VLFFGLCWFLDAGNDETLGRLSSPASKKRQGTKSRDVGHWLAAIGPIPDLGRDARAEIKNRVSDEHIGANFEIQKYISIAPS
jgi:hypothetical protein